MVRSGSLTHLAQVGDGPGLIVSVLGYLPEGENAMVKMTKAELKRRLVPGTELTLINCLMGPCNNPRTVAQVRSSDYVMLTPEGKHSYLTITPEEEVRETENGFQLILKAQDARPGLPAQPERIAAEYVWGIREVPNA